MSTLSESCGCGATFSATANYLSDTRTQAEAFREAHAVCRERVPQAPGGGGAVLGGNLGRSLDTPPPGFSPTFFSTPLWHAYSDDDRALDVLTAIGCPTCCVGYINDTGWHTECQRKAREALAILRPRDISQETPSATYATETTGNGDSPVVGDAS